MKIIVIIVAAFDQQSMKGTADHHIVAEFDQSIYGERRSSSQGLTHAYADRRSSSRSLTRTYRLKLAELAKWIENQGMNMMSHLRDFSRDGRKS